MVSREVDVYVCESGKPQTELYTRGPSEMVGAFNTFGVAALARNIS